MLSGGLKEIDSFSGHLSLPRIEQDERFDRLLRKARLINSHLLLERGARVAHIAYDDGKLGYVLAYSNPDYRYVCVLSDAGAVQAASEKYILPNVMFLSAGEFLSNTHEPYDAMIVADILYRLFYCSQYSVSSVTDFIAQCLKRLVSGGQLLIKDYSVTRPDDRVILELPYWDTNRTDVERLLRYQQGGAAVDIEEITTDTTYTRSFAMRYKHAYDFLLGKDKAELRGQDYWALVAFSTREYLDLIEAHEGRLLYMSPHRDEPYIRENFHERFRLYSDQKTDLGFPDTGYFFLIQKSAQNESLYIYEKEKLAKKPQDFSVSMMVDDRSGALYEIVKKHVVYADILPYRLTQDGRLNIFLTESTPHGIANTIASKVHNIDSRHWSGHMIDSIKLEAEDVHIYQEQGEHEVRQFMYDRHQIMTACGSAFETGPALYPAPDYIEELRECYYVRVCKNFKCPACLDIIKNSHARSRSQPRLKELDAQKVLNAIRVGLVPSTLLETQITYLMESLSVPVERGGEKNIPLERAEPKRRLGKRELMSFLSHHSTRFSEIRGRTNKINIVRSQFVDEGKVGDRIVHLASDEEEFITFNNQTTNTALVVPLTKDLGGEILAGFEARFLPVPERLGGASATIAAPSFPLPDSITNYDLAKAYIAKQFKVSPDRVGKLGESYFAQIDMTPHRIYPFVVATAVYDREGWGGKGGEDGFTAYSPLEEIWKLIYWDNTKSFMTVCARLMTRWGQDSDLSMRKKFSQSLVPGKISNTNNGSDAGYTGGEYKKTLDY